MPKSLRGCSRVERISWLLASHLFTGALLRANLPPASPCVCNIAVDHQYRAAGIPTDEVSLHRDISVCSEGFLPPCFNPSFLIRTTMPCGGRLHHQDARAA